MYPVANRNSEKKTELSDEHARDERAQDVAELEGPDPDPADHEADGEHQEDRQFRVLSKRVQQHVIRHETLALAEAPAHGYRHRSRFLGRARFGVAPPDVPK